MVRPSRRLTAVLLWIAMALLPMRSLGAALMPAMAQPAAPVAEAALPCHGADTAAAAVDAHGPHHEPAAAAVVGDCPTCSLCALCHGGVAHAAPPVLTVPAVTGAAPAMAPALAVAPHASDGLFRPPRSHLA